MSLGALFALGQWFGHLEHQLFFHSRRGTTHFGLGDLRFESTLDWEVCSSNLAIAKFFVESLIKFFRFFLLSLV